MQDFIKNLMGGTNKKQSFVNTLTGYNPPVQSLSTVQTVQKPVTQAVQKPAVQPKSTVVGNPSAVSPAVKTPAAQAYVSSIASSPKITNVDNVNKTYMSDGQQYSVDPTTGRYALSSSIKQAAPTTVSSPSSVSAPTQTVQAAAAQIPKTPSTKDAYLEAYKKYQEAQKMSAEEKSAREAYNNFLAEQSKAVAGREGRGFGAPIQIVRGEQEKLLRQTQPELARLQGDIGIAQTGREVEINAAKAGLDMQKDILGLETEANKPVVVDGVAYQRQADGSLKALTQKEQEAFNLSEGQSRYEIDPATGQYKLVASVAKTYAPKAGGSTTAGQVSSYRAEKATNVINQVDEALNMISPYTSGLLGTISGIIPGTGATDLQKAIDSIKANIGFDELQAMRDASKTGGALGQVAVQELNSLQSTLGSLDRKQSPQALYKNLQDIRDRYSKVAGIVNQIQSQGGSQEASAISQVEYPLGSGQYYNVDSNGDMTPVQ